jgi:hypothetical protein
MSAIEKKKEKEKKKDSGFHPWKENGKKPRKINSVEVEKWFRHGIREVYGENYLVSAWNVKHRVLAKKLLAEYGDDLTERGVGWFCRNWKRLVSNSNGRLIGCPTVQLLWAMKDQVFGEVQKELMGIKDEKGKEKNRDEFRADEAKDNKDLGW